MRYGREDRREKMGCRYHHSIQRKRGEQRMVPDHRTTPWWMRKNSFDARFENRVVYAESIRDIPAALDLLARHIIDQEASILFFDHAARLQRDLLTNASIQACRETASVRDTRIQYEDGCLGDLV